ncbi:MAG: YggU family protein [Flavobacteriales bacterium]|nr:YggU family protein [Flavobacteriales bacterium]
MPSWINESSGSFTLTLHVQPGAKRTEVAGTHGDALKIRLAAPPVDGKANEALLSYLAEQFGVPKRQVELVSGHASRRKVVRVIGAKLRPEKDW